MILYVGAHYLIILRNPEAKQDSFCRNKWRLYNDTKTSTFQNWCDVAKYCVEGSCLPTVLIYEQCSQSDTRLSRPCDGGVNLDKYEIEDLEKIANQLD